MTEDLDSFQLDMVVHAFNTSTRKVEDGRFLWIWGQSGLHNKFQNNQGYLFPVSKSNNNHKIYSIYLFL